VNFVFFIIVHLKLVNHSTFKWTNFGEAYTSATGQAILYNALVSGCSAL